MRRTRTNIGRILVPALVLLIFCGIVAAEFPELLTLTDSSRNDFTIRKVDSKASTIQDSASTHSRLAELSFNSPAIDLLFLSLRPIQSRTLVSSDIVTPYFVLRT
jgi:hypothetical protein